MFELTKDAYTFAKDSLKGRNGKEDKYMVIFMLTVEIVSVILVLCLVFDKYHLWRYMK
jgi:hypothetical protein